MDDVLKKLLGDLAPQVQEKIGEKQLVLVDKGQKAFIHKEDEEPIINNNGSYIPIKKFNDLNELYKSEKSLNTKNLAELETLKKSTGSLEQLQGQITKLKDDNIKAREKADASLLKVRKKFALKDALLTVGAKSKNANLLVPLFDLTKIELNEDDTIKDLENHLKPIMEEHGDLFSKDRIRGNDPHMPKDAPSGYITKEKFQAMSPSERIENADIINQSQKHWNK